MACVIQFFAMVRQILNVMKNYDENKESSYVAYLNKNNLFAFVMSQKVSSGGFIKRYDENSNIGYLQKI